MTVSDLRLAIMDLDPETEIILSSDGEGNSYRKAYAIDTVFCKTDKWEVKLCGEEEEGYDIPETKGVLCLVIWPE